MEHVTVFAQSWRYFYVYNKVIAIMRIKRLSYILLQNFHHFDFEYKLFAEILLLSFQANVIY